MPLTTALCPFCRDTFTSSSSSIKPYTKRLRHVRAEHEDKKFEDPILKARGKEHRA